MRSKILAVHQYLVAGAIPEGIIADISNLSKENTLYLFAEHYQSVLNTPAGTDHQNIRQFMQYGWEAVQFEGQALTAK